MQARVFHLTVDADEESLRDEAWDVSHRIQLDGETETVEQDEFDRLYKEVGADEVDAEAPAILHRMWERWNAGSGKESEAFVARHCTDCDAKFTGAQDDGAFDLGTRQRRAERHETNTQHDVERSTRSLMVGDCLVVDGDVFVCAPFGWDVTDLEVDG